MKTVDGKMERLLLISELDFEISLQNSKFVPVYCFPTKVLGFSQQAMSQVYLYDFKILSWVAGAYSF